MQDSKNAGEKTNKLYICNWIAHVEYVGKVEGYLYLITEGNTLSKNNIL
jgi:hypothetical protein